MAIDGPGGPDDPDDPEKPKRRLTAAFDGPLASDVEGDQPFGPRRQHALPKSERDSPYTAPEDRAKTLREIISDDSGRLIGVESSKRVREIPRDRVTAIGNDIRGQFGPPDIVEENPKGTVESWRIGSARAWVTYRNFSNSGGPTIDITRVPGLEAVKRFHEPRNETSD